MYRSSSGIRLAVVIALVLSAPLTLLAAPRVFEEQAKVVFPGPSDQLVLDAGISGDFMVSATRRNFDDPDGLMSEQFAYLFQRNSTTNQWQYVSTLAHSRTEHAATIPFAAGMEGNVIAVKTDVLNIFEHSAATGWSRTAQLPTAGYLDIRFDAGTIVLDGSRCAWEAFRKNSSAQWVRVGGAGPSSNCSHGPVDVSGSTVVVGNPLAGAVNENYPSAVRVYAGLSSTTPTSMIFSPFDDYDPLFGARVGIHGSTLLTSSSVQRGVSVFRRNSGGEWDYLSTTAAADVLMTFGESDVPELDLTSSLVIAGQSRDPHRGAAAGSVAVYRRNADGTLMEAARLLASDASPGAILGTDVAISGRRVVATAGRDAVYVFELPADLSQPARIQENFELGNAANWTQIAGSSFSVVPADGSRVYRQTSLTADAGSLLTTFDWKDHGIQVDVRPTAFDGTDRWFGLAVRRTDASNYYYVTVRNSNVIELKRMLNGAFQTLASAPLTVQLNRNYRLRLEAAGTWIRAYVDGKLAVQARDSSLTHGHAGVQMYRTAADYDNVVISPNPLTDLLSDTIHYAHQYRWSVLDGEWSQFQYEDGELTYRQTSLAGDGRSLTGATTGAQVVQVNARALSFAGTSSWFGVFARYVDARNYFYLTLRSDGTLSLRKLVNGSIVVLGTKPLTVTPNSWHNVRLEAIGNSLRAYVDGKLYLEATDTSHPLGRYGLVTYKTAAEFDNVLVSQP